MLQSLFGRRKTDAASSTANSLACKGLAMLIKYKTVELLEHEDIQKLPEETHSIISNNAANFLEGALKVLEDGLDAFQDFEGAPLKKRAGAMLAHGARNKAILSGSLYVGLEADLVKAVTSNNHHESLIEQGQQDIQCQP